MVTRSKQMEAILILSEHPLLHRILMPVINAEEELVDFNRINYGVLSGGERAAISWAWCIWKDEQVPADADGAPSFRFTLKDGVRDPFQSFGVLSRQLQILILQALLHRWS